MREKVVRVVSLEPFMNPPSNNTAEGLKETGRLALLSYQTLEVPRPTWMMAGVEPTVHWRIVNMAEHDWWEQLRDDLDADYVTRGIK